MQTMIVAAAAAVVGSPHGTSAMWVGKAVMQGNSRAAMLWHLQQFKAHVLTSMTLRQYDIFS